MDPRGRDRSGHRAVDRQPERNRAHGRGGQLVEAARHPQARYGPESERHGGEVVRINQRTATTHCDGRAWRVAFALLQHIVDVTP
ncbi:hypothetical protein C7T35_32375 [Variovorax sp. WS11]|nr:hypothetical protein C7T35_32375 [Variovorax sp. WS11]